MHKYKTSKNYKILFDTVMDSIDIVAFGSGEGIIISYDKKNREMHFNMCFMEGIGTSTKVRGYVDSVDSFICVCLDLEIEWILPHD